MAVQLLDQIIYQFADADGLLVGGQVFFYEAGSTTILQDIYVDEAESATLENPQTLGDLGQLQQVIYLNGNYNIVIFDRFGAEKIQRDNFNATGSSATVLDWMQDSQNAGSVIGKWTTVLTEGVALSGGDIVFGDSAGSGLYKLKASGDGNVDPESDSYDPDTGIGTDWISLSISSAEITQSDIDALQSEIDALENLIGFQNDISGLITSNSSLDSDHDIVIEIGTAQDSTNTYRMTSTSAFTKAIDANWAEGTAQGGLPSGLSPVAADTWYRLFIIGKDDDTAAFDYGFDTSATAINLLSDASGDGYNIYRQIGWVRTDASANILGFVQYDNYFEWKTPVESLNGNSLGTNVVVTVQAAPNTTSKIRFGGRNESAVTARYYISLPASYTVPTLSDGVCDIRTEAGSEAGDVIKTFLPMDLLKYK